MSEPIHPARQIPFSDLLAGLERARGLGFVHRRTSRSTGLQLFIYTPRCVYEDGWDEFTVMARGLILDEAAGQVVATPFPKFFNVGERRGEVPDLPFEAFEKLDGSPSPSTMRAGGRLSRKEPSTPSRRHGRRSVWTPWICHR